MAKVRGKVIAALIGRYAQATRRERGQILNELVAITGYHRKHAARMLRSDKETVRTPARPFRHGLDDVGRQTLEAAWISADRVCGKRLKPLMPTLLSEQIDQKKPAIDESVRQKLTTMSAATIDRALAGARARAKRRPRGAIFDSGLGDFTTSHNDADQYLVPGYMEIRLLARSRTKRSVPTQRMLLTDRITDWKEIAFLPAEDVGATKCALDWLRLSLPFPLLGMITSEPIVFQNSALRIYCQKHGIKLEFGHLKVPPPRRSLMAVISAVDETEIGYDADRPYSSDVEDVLSSVLSYWNYFGPRIAIRSASEVKESVIYDIGAVPYLRLLYHPSMTIDARVIIRDKRAKLNPKVLRKRIALHRAEHPEAEDQVARPPRRQGTAGRGAASQENATPARNGKHRDPFAAVADQLAVWFRSDPHISAAKLLKRLQAKHPGLFKPGQIRTLQRRMKLWRGS